MSLQKFGKQFSNDSTCFNVVSGSYDCCKLAFHGNMLSSRDQSISMNHAMRSNRIEFLLYLCNEFTSRSKHCQITISADTHNFFPTYTIVATNVQTTLSTSSALHVFSMGLHNSVFFSIETNVD